MAGKENLRPFSSCENVEQVREWNRKGGQNSQKVQKRKRLEREALAEMFAEKISTMPELVRIAKKYNIEGADTIQKLFNKLAILNEVRKLPTFETLIKYEKAAGEYVENAAVTDLENNIEVINNILFSDKQEAFINNPLKRINLLFGSVRSGKTFVSLVKFIKEVKASPEGSEFLIAGKTLTSVNRNCFGTLADLCGKMWNVSLSAKKAKLYGRTVWIEGANDKASESKIRGMTLSGAYIDELTQIPQEFYLMCLSRLSKPKAFLIATTNPDAPTHYVNTEIILNDSLDKQVVKFGLDDNIHLDSEYITNLKNEYQGVYYDRFILGEFVRAEGIVFRDFAENTENYIIKRADIPALKTIGVGYDLGGNKSNFALVAAGITYDDTIIVLRALEIVPDDIKLEDVERVAIEFIEGVESDYKKAVDYCYIDDNYYTTVNSLNDYRYIFDSATHIKNGMPLADRPIMLSKVMANGKFKVVADECNPLVEQLQNAVFDDRSEKAIIQDNGEMNIDEIDALFYSIAQDYIYLAE